MKARITWITKETFHTPREDHLVKREEWTVSDGRSYRIDTHKHGGTRTLAFERQGTGPWKNKPVATVKRSLNALASTD